MKRLVLFVVLFLVGTMAFSLEFSPPYDSYDPTKDLTSPFLERESVAGLSGGEDTTIHLGVDLVPQALRDNPKAMVKTYAVADGEIVTCYPPPGTIGYTKAGKKFVYEGHKIYGGLVIVRHWDDKTKMYSYSLYGHLKEVWVAEGTIIKRGTPIGIIGSTGKSTGPHLHFAIYYDPLVVINNAILSQKKRFW